MVSPFNIYGCNEMSLTAMVDPAAMELADELDGLPLALATAGAYLEETATTFSDYLRLYRESWLKLQKTSPELSSYEDRALYSTWQLSLDHIKQQNELSAKLLQLWAYFSNQDLWFELLRHGMHPIQNGCNGLLKMNSALTRQFECCVTTDWLRWIWPSRIGLSQQGTVCIVACIGGRFTF